MSFEILVFDFAWNRFMKQKRVTFSLLVLFALPGCIRPIPLDTRIVESDPGNYRSERLETQPLCFVITEELRRSMLYKSVTNMFLANLAPDSLEFDLGRSLADEFASLARNLSRNAVVVSDGYQCSGRPMIEPQLRTAEIHSPLSGTGTVMAEIEIQLKMTGSRGSGSQIQSSETVRGLKERFSTVTDNDLRDLLRETIEDVVLESKIAITQNLTPESAGPSASAPQPLRQAPQPQLPNSFGSGSSGLGPDRPHFR